MVTPVGLGPIRGSASRSRTGVVRVVVVRCVHPLPSTVTSVLSHPPADRSW